MDEIMWLLILFAVLFLFISCIYAIVSTQHELGSFNWFSDRKTKKHMSLNIEDLSTPRPEKQNKREENEERRIIKNVKRTNSSRSRRIQPTAGERSVRRRQG